MGNIWNTQKKIQQTFIYAEVLSIMFYIISDIPYLHDLQYNWHLKRGQNWDIPGGQVVKTPHFIVGDTGSILLWGTKMPYATWHGQTFKKREMTRSTVEFSQSVNIKWQRW